MPETMCIRCDETSGELPKFEIVVTRRDGGSAARDSWQQYRLRGVMECHIDTHPPHRWPIDVENRTLWAQREMPVVAAEDLGPNVQPGLVQDIKEAEEAHFNGLFKAATVMCRRAVQLSLEPIVPNGSGKTLGPLLTDAKAMSPPPLTPRGFLLADGIHQLGDIGAHREEEITDRQAKGAIEAAVDVLNELSP